MSDQRPFIPPFKPEDGLIITKVENGGWTVTVARSDRQCITTIIAAFSSAEDLVTALTNALTAPQPPQQVTADV